MAKWKTSKVPVSGMAVIFPACEKTRCLEAVLGSDKEGGWGTLGGWWELGTVGSSGNLPEHFCCSERHHKPNKELKLYLHYYFGWPSSSLHTSGSHCTVLPGSAARLGLCSIVVPSERSCQGRKAMRNVFSVFPCSSFLGLQHSVAMLMLQKGKWEVKYNLGSAFLGKVLFFVRLPKLSCMGLTGLPFFTLVF